MQYTNQLPKTDGETLFLIDEKRVASLVPKRKRDTNKGDHGKAAIVAGSVEYTGAAYLATAACLRAGAGYTALFVPKDILPYYVLKAPEALLSPLNDGGRVALNANTRLFFRNNRRGLCAFFKVLYDF